jgi:hypothetical protein
MCCRNLENNSPRNVFMQRSVAAQRRHVSGFLLLLLWHCGQADARPQCGLGDLFWRRRRSKVTLRHLRIASRSSVITPHVR